jgi:uncharacterized protein (TIGR02996 family)
MPTDDDAFLRAIGAAPADDAPRLVYADWLDDRGDAARAEFIRVQCELARPGGDRARRTELRLRERELWMAQGSAFPGCRPEFRRGFAECIAGAADRLERLPSDLFAAGIVQEVRVTGPLRPAAAVRGFSHMGSIRVLRLCSLALNDIDLWALHDAEQFTNLDALDLRWNDLTPDGFRRRVADDLLPPGRTLLLGGNHFGPADRAELSEVLGDRVSFAVERATDHLYSLTTNSGRMTGITADGRQAVLVRYMRTQDRQDRFLAFCFDLDGHFLGTEQSGPTTRRARTLGNDPVVRTFAAQLGLVPGPIAIRRFHDADTGYGVTDFTPQQWDLIQNPPPVNTDDPEEADRADEYRHLKYDWVPNGGFVFGVVDG